MDLILREMEGQVAVLKLNRGPTNPINLDLINELSGHLQSLNDDPRVRGVVLASSNDKFFSIGFDIPYLINLEREVFWSFYRPMNRCCMQLFMLSKPVVAAITGHAVAGGCVFALCCDYRIIAEGKKLMGLNEIKLGVPVPYPADCMLRALIGNRYAQEIMITGDFYQPEQSLVMGLVDSVLPLDRVLPAAIARAADLGSMPDHAFRLIKRNRVEIVETQILSRLEEKEELFLDCWFHENTRQRLRKAMEKF